MFEYDPNDPRNSEYVPPECSPKTPFPCRNIEENKMRISYTSLLERTREKIITGIEAIVSESLARGDIPSVNKTYEHLGELIRYDKKVLDEIYTPLLETSYPIKK